jgi:hypothetical protein
MAKAKRDEQLFQRLRAHGLRKRAAKIVADNTNRRGKPAKAVNQVLSDLNKLVREAEDRVTGGPAKRQAAAKKAVKTRRANAQTRSNAAKKAARTRAKARA